MRYLVLAALGLVACGDHAVRPMTPELDPASQHASEPTYQASANPLDGAVPDVEDEGGGKDEHNHHRGQGK